MCRSNEDNVSGKVSDSWFIQFSKLYYEEFKIQMAADPVKALKIATMYSYAANEADDEEGGLLVEENSEDTFAIL